MSVALWGVLGLLESARAGPSRRDLLLHHTPGSEHSHEERGSFLCTNMAVAVLLQPCPQLAAPPGRGVCIFPLE